MNTNDLFLVNRRDTTPFDKENTANYRGYDLVGSDMKDLQRVRNGIEGLRNDRLGVFDGTPKFVPIKGTRYINLIGNSPNYQEAHRKFNGQRLKLLRDAISQRILNCHREPDFGIGPINVGPAYTGELFGGYLNERSVSSNSEQYRYLDRRNHFMSVLVEEVAKKVSDRLAKAVTLEVNGLDHYLWYAHIGD